MKKERGKHLSDLELYETQILSAETMIKRILEKYKIPKGDVEKVLGHAKAIEIAAMTKVKKELKIAEHKAKQEELEKENKDHEEQDLLQPNRLTV